MQMCLTTRSLNFTCVKLHAPYLHALSMNTTHRLHAFYVRVSAATPLTRTVDQKLLGYRILAKWGLKTRLLQVMRC